MASTDGDGGSAAELPPAVAAVLASTNHYEALGLEEKDAADLDDNGVRRAYLKASVKVHPDKHPGVPEATEAFQKLSAVINELLRALTVV